jgi:hypothetical protein
VSRWFSRERFIACLALIAVAAFFIASRGPRRGTTGAAADLVLNVAPAAVAKDPGPTLVAGGESDAGTSFIGADLLIDGPGDVRVYFDRHDNANFHFLDRKEDKVTLGLCEAGLEQIFSTGKVDAAASMRLARHGPNIALFQSGHLILCAFDERLLGGTAGFRMLSQGNDVTLKVEPREDVHFADDFMYSDARGAQWSVKQSADGGYFNVKSLKNPLLSANAFNYMGCGKENFSTVGQPWWDLYVYEASVRGPANGCIGLMFSYQDDRNYGLFKWTARKVENGAVTDPGKRELVRVHDGKPEILAQSSGGYGADQWYSAQLRVTYSRVSVAMDGHVLLEVADPNLACGSVGVWCDVPIPAAIIDPRAQEFSRNSLNDLMKAHAVFDDVRVNTLQGYEDDFVVPGPLAGGWLVGTGDWTVRAEKNTQPELTVAPTKGSTKALVGDRRWAQYEVEADVRSGGGSAGLIFLHRDESNYFQASIDKKSLKLTSVSDGNAVVVDTVPLLQAGKQVRLRAQVRHGHVRVTADDGVSVESFAGDTMLRGRAGFVATAGESDRAPAAFSRFRLSFLPEREPLVTTNAVFEDEQTMNDWTSPTSEWYPPRDPLLIKGRPVNLLWHRSQFPGDVELAIEPREAPEGKFEFALSVAKDGQGKNNGYVFHYEAGDITEGASRSCTAQLIRQGEVVAERVVVDDAKQFSVASMRRCGKYIVGLLNGRPVVSYRDENPLVGNKVAYYTQGLVVRTEATKIISDNFRNDLFSRAPVNWRTGGNAIAEVTNRWQCDPRWSFFSLKNDLRVDRRNKPAVQWAPAVLWSKYLYPGDVTVEFYVGNKMETERGQPYFYARDICVNIGSDGSDLTKGYTFMWGGFGNQRSVILRNGVEVARVTNGMGLIPKDMNYHRHWFSFKVEKQRGRLSFRVDRFFANDRSPDLVYEDTQPLTGDRIALWTYDHAIMISRVRISGDGGNMMEDVDWTPGALKTPLDDK